MSRFNWEGDLEDDCSLSTMDSYGAHAEAMSDNEWYCSVWRGDRPNSVLIFHSNEDDVMPKTGEAARKLCEWVIDAHRQRHTAMIALHGKSS